MHEFFLEKIGRKYGTENVIEEISVSFKDAASDGASNSVSKYRR